MLGSGPRVVDESSLRGAQALVKDTYDLLPILTLEQSLTHDILSMNRKKSVICHYTYDYYKE